MRTEGDLLRSAWAVDLSSWQGLTNASIHAGGGAWRPKEALPLFISSMKQMCFQQKHNRGFCQLPPCLALTSVSVLLLSLEFLKQSTRRGLEPMKGAVAAQKALQGSETRD